MAELAGECKKVMDIYVSEAVKVDSKHRLFIDEDENEVVDEPVPAQRMDMASRAIWHAQMAAKEALLLRSGVGDPNGFDQSVEEFETELGYLKNGGEGVQAIIPERPDL